MALTSKISVILPVYNSALTIRRCIDSLQAQTYPDLEMIFVIDASPDESQLILQEYAGSDSRIVMVPLTENAGVSHARNTGIKAATGEYIYFLDPDDFIDPDTFLLLAGEFDKPYDLIIPGFSFLTQDKERRSETILPPYCGTITDLKELGLYYSDLYEKDILFFLLGRLYKRSLIALNSIQFISTSLGEDQCFALTCLINCQSIKICRFAGYNYVINTGPSLSKGTHRSYETISLFLNTKFSLINKLRSLLDLPAESIENYFTKNILFYLSMVISIYSPGFPVPVRERKNRLREFRRSPGHEIYRHSNVNLNYNLLKIPVCYLPVTIADFMLKKTISLRFANVKFFRELKHKRLKQKKAPMAPLPKINFNSN